MVCMSDWLEFQSHLAAGIRPSAESELKSSESAVLARAINGNLDEFSFLRRRYRVLVSDRSGVDSF